MRSCIYILLFLLFSSNADAQLYQLFTQVQGEESIINPAYTGRHDYLATSTHTRKSWTGFTKAPTLNVFSVNAPFYNENTGIGLLFLNETDAFTSMSDLFIQYSYKVRISSGNLYFGLRVGSNIINTHFNEVNTIEHNDPVFSGIDNVNIIRPNFGTGITYIGKSYHVGISVPLMLHRQFDLSDDSQSIFSDFMYYNYFLTAGKEFVASDIMQLQTALTVRTNLTTSTLIDVNANMSLNNDVFVFGVGFRTNNSAYAVVQGNINDQLRIGYSYDFFANYFNNYINGSHEVFIRYKFLYNIKAETPLIY